MSQPASSQPVSGSLARVANKRRSRRQQPKRSTRAVAYGNALGLGRNIATGVLDVSETGVRLRLKQDLPVGKEFEIVLEGVGNRSIRILAEVVWSIPAADGTFVVGSKFQKNVNYGDLQSLVRF